MGTRITDKETDLHGVLARARGAVKEGRISRAEVRAGERAQEDPRSYPDMLEALAKSLGEDRLATLREAQTVLWRGIMSGRKEPVDGHEIAILQWAATVRRFEERTPTTDEMAGQHLDTLVYLAAAKVYASYRDSGRYPRVEILEAKLVRNGWTQAEVQVTEVDTLADLPGSEGANPSKPNHPGSVLYEVPGICRLNLVAALPPARGGRRIIVINKLVRHPFYQCTPVSGTGADGYRLTTRGVPL